MTRYKNITCASLASTSTNRIWHGHEHSVHTSVLSEKLTVYKLNGHCVFCKEKVPEKVLMENCNVSIHLEFHIR